MKRWSKSLVVLAALAAIVLLTVAPSEAGCCRGAVFGAGYAVGYAPVTACCPVTVRYAAPVVAYFPVVAVPTTACYVPACPTVCPTACPTACPTGCATDCPTAVMFGW